MATARPVRTVQGSILASLLLLSAAAWALLIWQSRSGGAGMMDERPLTMGMGAPLFLAMWVLMMVAVMFPTAAPMVLTFARISQGRQAQGQPFVPAWFFVASYLALWSAFGVVAYLLAIAADWALSSFVTGDGLARLGGAVLIVTGLYQLSPLKGACLSKCRSPFAFILSSWKDGYRGALQMGLVHGTYCLGCCWLLFMLLFPLGVMNVAAMGLVTLLIFAEKSLPRGLLIGRTVGVGLAVWGIAVMVSPWLLPMAV